MKILVIGLLNFIVYLIAIDYKKNHKMKIAFYNSAIHYSKDLLSYIAFNKNTAYEVFNFNKSNYCGDFVETVQTYFSNNKIFSRCLNNAELAQFEEFVNSLGKYDVEETLKNINFYKLRFEQIMEDLKALLNRKVEPIFKIIIILGIVLSIIIL